MLKEKTMKNLQKAIEDARKEGVAIVGYAMHPEAVGMMKLDNQHLTLTQFVALVDFANHTFEHGTTDAPQVIAIN